MHLMRRNTMPKAMVVKASFEYPVEVLMNTRTIGEAITRNSAMLIALTIRP